MLTCTAIVLAGGESSRMGRDKASLPFGAETLLERVVRTIRDDVNGVIVAARPGQAVPGEVTVVFDEEKGAGPLLAVAAALALVETPLTIVLACDMPLLRPAVVRRLISLIGEADAAVPSVEGHWMTTCAVVRTARAIPAAAALAGAGERSLRALVNRLDTRTVSASAFRDVDPTLLSFVGCNTPEEYRRALAVAGLLGGGSE
jgi:molybdopterin-guanine dinucleotide biosynthesis protein A